METKAPKTTLRDRIGTAEPETSPAPATLTPPLPGEYWHGQGGYYAGIIHNPENGARWHLIMAPTAFGPAKWMEKHERIENANCFYDGLANTQHMIASEHDHPIIDHIVNAQIEGHFDFYLPALRELCLLSINTKHIYERACYWSSSQHDAIYAWFQDFSDVYQYLGNKVYERAARAVRRLPIQEVNPLISYASTVTKTRSTLCQQY